MAYIRKGRKPSSSSSSNSSGISSGTPKRMPLRQGAPEAPQPDDTQEEEHADTVNPSPSDNDSNGREEVTTGQGHYPVGMFERTDERDSGDLYDSNGSPLRTYEDDPDLPLPRGRIPVAAPQSRIPKRSRADEENHRPMIETIINQTMVVTLDNEISESLAQAFFDQALRPTFNMAVADLIQERALRRVKLAVMASYADIGLEEGADTIWPYVFVNDIITLQPLITIAEQIKILFGTRDQAETILDLDRRLREVTFTFAYNDVSLEQAAFFKFQQLILDYYRTRPDLLTPIRQHLIAKIFFENLPKDHEVTRLYVIKTKEEVPGSSLDTYENAYRRFVKIMTEARKIFKSCIAYGSYSKRFKKDETFSKGVPSRSAAAQDKTLDKSSVCDCCGRHGHTRTDCRNANNPDCNQSELPWSESPVGMKMKAMGKSKFTIVTHPSASTQDRGKSAGKDREWKKKPCKFFPTILAALSLPRNSEFLTVLLSLPFQTRSQATAPTEFSRREKRTQTEMERKEEDTRPIPPEIEANALLDTGSLAGDFISDQMVKKLNATQFITLAEHKLCVCSGLDNNCLVSNEIIHIDFSYYVGNIKNTILIQMRVLANSDIDVIIGRDTIKQYNLAKIFPQFFFLDKDTDIGSTAHKMEVSSGPIRTPITPPKSANNHSQREDAGTSNGSRTAQPATLLVACTSTVEGTSLRDDTNSVVCTSCIKGTVHPPPFSCTHGDDTHLAGRAGLITSSPSLAPLETANLAAALLEQTEPLHEVYTHTPSFRADDVDCDSQDMFAPFRTPPETSTSDESFMDRMTIEGDPETQLAIRKLCKKYKHIFSDKLDTKPASIPPFDLIVDKQKWEIYRNRGPVRVQSTVKQIEIHKQVQEMLKAGIIEKSDAAYYSQVMLTPKPDGTFRFCADYRAMNDATQPASWPIPNIKQMLARLGSHKSDTFGVMDLTSGYHQAPLTLAARVFTAFITFAGVYQFTRLPFGPKRAPSYFQEMMASIVLLGLIYNICEMYLDDCIVHAKGSDEFLQRLEIVFKRFSDKNIKLKASKCKFGLKLIEYVGRQISKAGISMSTTKIRAVQEFPKPVVLTQLRSFLGLANYFRDFVPNHSNVVSPLHQMIDHAAKKQSKLIWTVAGETAYEAIKDLISKSPLLYFMSDTAPIVLMTDASDYGVGGYLYQLVDGEEQLVALVSKSLTDTQLKWSVIQKEAYAIAFCCKSLEALLRDRKFTIRTDHKNLTFMKEESNPMVQRWYTALQELDYDLKYVPGKQNTIADAMSRLCPNYKIGEDNTPKVLAALHSQPVIDDENNITIERCHNPMVGHGGVERTLRKIKDLKLSWPTMRADVKQFIRECPCCQKMSQIKTPINVLKFTTSTYRPMDTLNIDFIGPFPDKGYVLVIIDTFSRWVELYATNDATAKAACKCLIEHFGRFGCPSYIRSDNGPHFVNDLIRLFLEATGTPHNRTLAYSSEENAIVERSNKEVNRHIRTFIFQRGTIENYQQVLPFVQRILNSEIHSKLNASPATILFGNAVNLDRGILLPDDEQPPTQSLSKATSKMLHMQFLAIKAAKKSLEQADSEHKASTPTELTEFASNSYVIAMQRSAPETRLHTLWRGPFRVLSKTGSQYSLLDLITGKEKLYHVTQLKAFHFNPLKTDPVDVARKDYLEFFIESIIQLEGSFDKLATLRFKIKWLGYDETHNTWEPWKNLRKTTALHQFLIAKQLRHRIPKEFQSLYPE